MSDPQIVRVPGATRYVAVEPELTRPVAEPAPPAPLCVDQDGHAVLCDYQVLLFVNALRSWGGQCYADKAAIETLGGSDGR